MISNDPVCSITIPKDDEIVLSDIEKYGDRWFLGFMDAYDPETNDKVGEIMYEAFEIGNIFKLTPWSRFQPDAFEPIPNIRNCYTKYRILLPDVVDMLHISGDVLHEMSNIYKSVGGIVNVETVRPTLMIKVYNSWKGCAKARAEYFLRNRDFLNIDPSIDDAILFRNIVYPTSINPDPESFTINDRDGNPIDPVGIMTKMCNTLDEYVKVRG